MAGAAWELITPPADEPVTLAEAKAHLRVTHDFEDALIAGLVEAARTHAEKYTHRAFCTQAWELRLCGWPCSASIDLPAPPLISVDWVKYVDLDGTLQTLSTSLYGVDTFALPGRVYRAYNATWPSVRSAEPGAVRVRFSAGYGGPEKVPATLKQAILLLVGHWYEHREAVLVGTISGEIPTAAAALLWNHVYLRTVDYG